METPTDKEWNEAIGFLMNAFNASQYESADDEINHSWRSVAYHMIEYHLNHRAKIDHDRIHELRASLDIAINMLTGTTWKTHPQFEVIKSTIERK